jgi:peptidoglycan/xylan/chitin deacetylase (PgdA/CDA1 family)
MLVFSILERGNVSEYCHDLSNTLSTFNIDATVFFSGKVAELNPDAVSCFGANIDIGSQTYSYVNLTSIKDYAGQLEEVRKGKAAVDEAGNLYSRIFRAPWCMVDQNIYSLLSRSDIIADFSYESQYNLCLHGEFVRFDISTFRSSGHSAEYFLELPKKEQPLVIITFDNTQSIFFIDSYLSELNKGGVEFVNASTIANATLTIRGN